METTKKVIAVVVFFAIASLFLTSSALHAQDTQVPKRGPGAGPGIRDKWEDRRDRKEDKWDRKEDIKDRREDVRDKGEDFRDRRENRRDRREDIRERHKKRLKIKKERGSLRPPPPAPPGQNRENGGPGKGKGLHRGEERGVRDRGEGLGRKKYNQPGPKAASKPKPKEGNVKKLKPKKKSWWR